MIVSSWQSVSSGVPQGSVLGSVLFLVYVNHVVQRLTCKYKIFADDIKMYISSSPGDPQTGSQDLQHDIETLVATSASWGLAMNVTKCVCMRFGPRTLGECSSGASPYRLSDSVIKYTACHKDLGVRVDRKLKFHDHIRTTASKCNALSTNIFSSTLCRNKQFMLNVYKSLIRPQLEYGCTLWNLGYLGDIRSLERVQRRWTRMIEGMEGLLYSERLGQLELFSVQGRLLRADLILAWKIFEGECAIDPAMLFVLDRSSRRGHSRKIFLPRSSREVRRRFFSVRVVHVWNSLSEETVTAPTINQFKRLLCRDLGQRLYAYTE